jgi:site-specific DNA recombinase
MSVAEELGTRAPDQIRAMLIALLSRIDIRPDHVEISIRRGRLVELLAALSIDPTTQKAKSDKESEDVLTLMVRARLQRVGREMRMLVENSDDQPTADPGLLRIIARAHEIQARLLQDTDLTVHVIASQGRVSEGYLSRLLRLPSLAPVIITAIVNGKNPPQLTAKKLNPRGDCHRPPEADASTRPCAGRGAARGRAAHAGWPVVAVTQALTAAKVQLHAVSIATEIATR